MLLIKFLRTFFLMDWHMIRPRGLSNEDKKRPRKYDSSSKSEKILTRRNEATYSLRIRIESPPLVAFGPPETSTGALLSGILDLYPPAPPTNSCDATFDVGKLEMKL